MSNKVVTQLSDFFGQFIKRYAPAIITLVLLAGAFFYYTHVIIEENERNIKERSFRGLNRIGWNIRQKINIYSERNSKNFIKELAPFANAWKDQETDTDILRITDQYGLHLLKVPPKTDSGNYFSVKPMHGWQIVFDGGDSIRAGASVKDFVQSFLRRDLFNSYFIARGNQVLFDELNLSNDSIASLWKGLMVKDSIHKDVTREFGLVELVEAGGKKYKLFMVPFTVKDTHHFVIGGYMPVDDFIAESKYIPGNAIMWLVFGIVLVILMFPLLKVFLMNRSEPLMPRNVLTSLMSLHLLGSIIIIILVNVYAYFNIIKRQADDELKNLANSIQGTFQQEVSDAIDEIDSSEVELVRLVNQKYDLLKNGRLPDLYLPTPGKRVYRIAETVDGKRASEEIDYVPLWLGKKYRYFENIAWADSSGNQLIRWTNNAYVPRKLNIRDRDYFQAVTQGSLLRTNGNKDYFLTAITSWVSQQKLAIITRRSRLNDTAIRKLSIPDAALNGQLNYTLSKLEVVSLSAPLRSIFSPILPYGFGFCVVNDQGNVLFHYDENRSLNENLLEECNEDVKLSSLLNTGASGYFNAHYTGSNNRFYAQPIDKMPYYLVTFYDIENSWNQDLDIVSASSILVMLNMGVILLLVLITRTLSFRMLSRSILFIWIEPKFHRRYAYLQATVAFVVASLLLLIFSFSSGIADELYLVGISLGFTHILVGYSFYVYNKSDTREKARDAKLHLKQAAAAAAAASGSSASPVSSAGSATLSTSMAAIPASQKLRLPKAVDRGRPVTIRKGLPWLMRKVFRPLPILIILYLISTVIFCIKLQGGVVTYICAQGLMLLSLWPISVLLCEQKLPHDKTDYKLYYYFSLYGFILATAIAPTLLFYFLSFKEEQKLAVKYQQMDFVNTFLHRKPFAFYQRDSVPKTSYHFPFHHSFLADQISWDKGTEPMKRAVTCFGKLYNAIKPSFSSYAKRIEYLNGNDSLAGSYTWDDGLGMDSLRFRMNVLQTRTYAEGDQRILATKKMPTVFNMLYSQWKQDRILHFLYTAILLAFLAGIYVLLVRLIPKIFFFHKPRTTPLQMMNEHFITLLPKVNHVFVVGIINSGKYKKIKDSFKGFESGGQFIPYIIHELDIAWLVSGDAANKNGGLFEDQWKAVIEDLDHYRGKREELQKRVVVIRHFDMKMNDVNVSEEKLKKVESLLAYKFVKVVISSSRHFEAMTIAEGAKDLSDRWANVMNNFCMFYHQWEPEQLDLSVMQEKPVVATGNAGNVATLAKDAGLALAPVPAKGGVANAGKADSVAAAAKPLPDYQALYPPALQRKLLHECAHSAFLYGLMEPIKLSLYMELTAPGASRQEEESSGRCTTADLYASFCLKLQTLAHHYYLSLWQSLTGDEQRTLYDIAGDGLMNQRNHDVADNLHALGILKINDSETGYRVMNESFRRFILTRIDKKEITKLHDGTDPNHSWNRFQLPVMLVVAAVSVFLFTTQKEAFNNLIAYLGAAAAAIAALLKVLDVFPSSKPPGGTT